MSDRRRHGRIDIVKILMGLAAATGLWAVYAFVPPQWAEREMHNVVIMSLFEWRDRSLESAKKSLSKEMDKAEIPEYIWPEDCTYWEDGEQKHMNCYWEVDVFVPFTEKLVKTLEFEVHKYLDAKGNVHDQFEE